MNKQPIVSTVIICFNSEKFIEDAIASVINQTYENWELLLVDDGSSDRSPQIMQDYVAQYPQKIRYLEHENHQNHGKNASRNLGIENAVGKYVALLDSDDVWLPHKLEQQVAILERYPEAGMIYGRNYDWYSWTGNPEDKERDCPHRYPLGVESNKIIFPPKLLVLLLEGETQPPTTCSPLFRREVFEKVGLFDPNFHDIFEDQDFFAKVLHYTPVFISDELWAKYRQHHNSSMGKYDAAVRQDINIWYEKRLGFLKSVENYLSQQEIKHPEVWECLNKCLSRLEKKLYLSRIPLISGINTWWVQVLETSMQIGRRILPFTLRDWLWKKLGTRLYF
ncbi:MAG: glycosyltransferase family A protein [Cyanobacteria bacterium P01_A01_bin.40]